MMMNHCSGLIARGILQNYSSELYVINFLNYYHYPYKTQYSEEISNEQC
jgi:hypothetical protein